ncbi:universal stress protein UspE [Shewanella sp. 1_MG-2023]|uniref:Universal stress protein UspE n=1 Tax=Shewanella electrodiphila TaxID=934143 RepID=A0ABT0KSQ0_9GAMM|nr:MULTISPECIES: universal stress protein UspE [Shewanella]MCL1046887.1 universal stress protein UspE [Shewanella electrodiphila]MDO6613749.1 universal stress protein UspE [Shewanella sp. 7_MG-2023]MDO6772643.1 universal stress protein UspE [Shewanella sp. 2_MG-2023]MDO6796553.1 universal stress protein UspE [Shewanella sp. 1_MG-2023]PMG78151.1 universal stress protein UspE [Shewanella sp. 10N.286.51.B7]
MKDYNKILVVINPMTDHQPALARAVELASKSNASITAFLTIFDFSYEMTSILSSHEREAMRQGVIDQRESWLAEAILPYAKSGLTIDTKVVWHNRPFESVIKYAIEQDVDLLVKSTHEHDKLKSIIFTPTDWHLLRKAPIPVLMVKDHDWPVAGKILCAVNVASEDDEHSTLNTKIIENALNLAAKFSAQIHLVNGYPGTPVNLAIELPEFDAASYNDTVRMQHEQRIQYLANSFNIPLENCHVEEGLPEDVIPELALKLDAELVILGTVGRTGFSAALIGNTAEHVIDSINCDLLAVKPEGYKSPLED